MQDEDILNRIRTTIDLSAHSLSPPIAEPDLKQWEDKNGVTLPSKYRSFLKQVGDGWKMDIEAYGFHIYPLEKVVLSQDLASPFPISKQRVQERLQTGPAVGSEAFFPELETNWGEVGEPPPGTILFGMYPGGDPVFLVVNGDLKGSIWCAVNSGVPEIKTDGQLHDFLSWFEDCVGEFV